MVIEGNCNLCSLYKKENPIKLEKNNSKVLLIFQAPGLEEKKLKRPIISRKVNSAGYRLTKSWHSKSKERSDFDITNAVLCYPGFDEKTKRDKKPDSKSKRYCLNNLEADIVDNNYSKIICFGTVAINQIKKIKNKIKHKVEIIERKHPCANGVKDVDLDELW